jgi:hypothetical protein
MDTSPPARPLTARPGLLRGLAVVILLAGLAATVQGLGRAIGPLTRPDVDVQVRVSDPARLRLPLRVDGAERRLAIDQQGYLSQSSLHVDVPGAPDGTYVDAPFDRVTLNAWDATVPERLFSHLDEGASGLCVGLGALLLYQLLLSVAEGRPFDPRNPRRIAAMAGLLLVSGFSAQLLPKLGARLLLERLTLAGPGSPLTTVGGPFDLGFLIGAMILLALAEAFRRGSLLARDVEGLV